MICKWLPDLYPEPEWNRDYSKYEDELYNVFCNEYMSNNIFFLQKIVSLRYHPEIDGKSNSFYHFICKNQSRNEPDKRRIQRIFWPKAFIQNYDCNENCCNSKPLRWKKKHKNGNYRYHIYFERYLVILEERTDYFLLITGFYVEQEYYHRGKLKESEKCESF